VNGPGSKHLLRGVFLALLIAVLLLSACVEINIDLPTDEPPATEAAPVEDPGEAPDPNPTETPAPLDSSIEPYFTGSETRAAVLIEALTTALAGASDGIDMAMYNFSLDEVGHALLDAKARGVRVRVVAESDSLDGRWFQRFRDNGIEVLGDRREGLMHNKFLVIDGREVWTGSLNLTWSGISNDDNNFTRFVSPDLAQRYTAVFDAMFEDDRFGPDRLPSALSAAVTVEGTPVEVYFSPADRAEKHLVELVRGANKSIRMLAYSFTSDALGEALMDQAAAGLVVQIVCDEDQADGQGAEYAALRQAGLDVRLDGNSGLMHNKVLIIDDEIVVLGSYNFTRAANQTNDENVVVVMSAQLAGQYQAAFERIYRAGH
jgi:phosphatidylserine/phosphatidylglycerophosphate/cardiolipin synthase-like enzyme